MDGISQKKERKKTFKNGSMHSIRFFLLSVENYT